ncbi:MAG: NHLP family bacteriocin export ABC transporter peptidase/permease/ATPase subunit [Atopobiaceae bacterium]|nr:NHLP family bacteriocin export ABC transporter peptidase/permease/ATPase subunit [Atopobiaceae bacterium]
MGKKDIKQPVKKGVAKVPVIMQLEALECGAASLAMVLAYYDKWIPLEQVRSDCGVSRDGSKAKNVALAAMHYGLDVKAYRLNPKSIQEKATFPCIIHWNMNHFVVLDGFKGNHAYLNDPARGNVSVTMEEFDECFTGVTIVPTPGPDFEPSGKPKSMLDFARKRLAGAGAAIAFVMLTTAITYLFGIINSFTSRIFMDRLLTGVNPDWLDPFINMMIWLAIIQIVVAWAQAVYALKINGKMAVIGSTSYMWKVLRLPMNFFSQRQAGDIQGRLALNSAIAGTLVNTLAPLLLNTCMAAFYLIVMFKQSVPLTLVGLTALLLNIAVSGFITKQRINITRVQLRDQAKLESTKASGIAMIETIKSSGSENGFFQKWAGYQASVNTQTVKTNKTNMLIGKIPLLLTDMANYGILVLGVFLTMQGEYTMGGVFMFQGFLTSFMTPAQDLISSGQTIQEMRTQMERVEDVMEYPDDESFKEHEVDASAETKEVEKLQGYLELKDVTFGYSKLEKPLIENFSLKLKPGERVALVGASGCGKSTVAKLVSGLYQPWGGEILLDGKPRDAYPRDAVVGSLAVVDQDITLFEDTIAENIKMWDSTIEDFEVIMAARDAQLHDDITKLSDGYQHKLTSGGKNLSGGQRQRMEIARVLAQEPTIIIMDEATSALDARTEYDVVNSIHQRGITCIVIAHRLSTVRDCDEIIVLNRGKVVERGTHDELMSKGGAYADLVSNE